MRVTDGLVILATSAGRLDEWMAATGAPGDLMTAFDAAGEYAAIVVQLPATGAESCVESVAVVNDGSADDLLIVDGGDDRFNRQVADDSLVFQVGDGRPDGAITRYPLTVEDPRFAAMVLSGLNDSPPLTC